MAPRGRRWLWFGLVVEASKPLVGVTLAMSAIADCLQSMATELHADLAAHYNYLRGMQEFRDQTLDELEGLPEVWHGEP